jgi:hypothetical protein
MQQTKLARFPTRLFVAQAGVLIVAVLWAPLELGEFPGSLRPAVPIVWGLIAALWLWTMWRWETVWNWARAHRTALLSAAAWGGVFYGAILVGLFYLMWLLGRLWMGQWPRAIPMHDPNGMPPTAVIHMLICGWFWYWPVALALPIGRFIHAHKNRKPRATIHLLECGITLVFIMAATLWLTSDPHQLVRWFLD